MDFRDSSIPQGKNWPPEILFNPETTSDEERLIQSLLKALPIQLSSKLFFGAEKMGRTVVLAC